MKSNEIFSNVWRFILLVLMQVLILKRINFGMEHFNYVSIIIYPLFLMLLPIRIPDTVLLLIGFVLGFTIDIFYDSLGVHASASVFLAFIRPIVLSLMEPRAGYTVNSSPGVYHMGLAWFYRYVMVLLFAHLFFYFSVEAFTFVYIKDILLRTISSFLFSFLFIMIIQILFQSRK